MSKIKEWETILPLLIADKEEKKKIYKEICKKVRYIKKYIYIYKKKIKNI